MVILSFCLLPQIKLGGPALVHCLGGREVPLSTRFFWVCLCSDGHVSRFPYRTILLMVPVGSVSGGGEGGASPLPFSRHFLSPWERVLLLSAALA